MGQASACLTIRLYLWEHVFRSFAPMQTDGKFILITAGKKELTNALRDINSPGYKRSVGVEVIRAD